MPTKPFVAMCALYAIACGCGVAAMAIHSGAVDALILAALAAIIPAWLLCVYHSEIVQ